MLHANRIAGAACQAGHLPAIDGLRAVAVLAVILFHLRTGLLPGGYAGVDIFFVISGFVVTRSLTMRPHERLRTALAGFYARRMIRLLPALLVMIVCVTLASILFVPLAGSKTDIREMALAAAMGASNILLVLTEAHYFAPSADLQPLLHSWTLGVEEQFYLACPWLIWLWTRGRRDSDRRLALLSVAAATAGSLLLCLLLRTAAPRALFFLMPTRFWELGLGVLLSLTSAQWQPRLASFRIEVLSAAISVGTAGLLAAMLMPGSPGWLRPSVVAVLSAAVIAAIASALGRHWSDRLLAGRGAVWIGRRSYSLYLWHWPVFALFRWTIGLEGAFAILLSLAMTFGLAALSYAVVERPFSSYRALAERAPGRVIAAGLAAIAVCVATILLLFSQERVLTLSRIEQARPSAPSISAGCAFAYDQHAFHGGVVRSWSPTCGGVRPGGRLLVAGDSHARVYAGLIQRHVVEHKVPATIYHHSGCRFPPVLRQDRDMKACQEFRSAVARELVGIAKPGDILFLPGLRIRDLTIARGTGADIPVREGSEFQKNEAEILAALRAMAMRGVVLIFELPKPVLPSAPFRCSDWFNRGNPECRRGLAIARADIDAMRAPVVAEMERLAKTMPNVILFDPLPILCPGDRCGARRGGTLIFLDGNHVTDAANDLLYPAFERAIAGAKGRHNGAADPVRRGPQSKAGPDQGHLAPGKMQGSGGGA
ncbi:acyltransferase family protein [Sphingosinicella sp. BN140058]|uniref:acyltransferase family protein n=1 Tax=Sphingosinicella sp. BN140058 TaxID=1892855 RepID=UPI00101110E3|nr:acyltransferase family protein [Sphingosinicella sp. BN140058]QAY75114.1 acyltransferase [Sphingosinicella sp. BN140058]